MSKKATRWQKQVILELLGHCGVPQSLTEIDVLLKDAEVHNQKKYREVYGIVVDKNLPSQSSPVQLQEESNREIYLEGIEKYMEGKWNSCVEKLKQEILSEIAPVKNKPRKISTGIRPKEFEDILALAEARINILLWGPSGCGKTFIAEKVAEALGLEFSSQSCTAGMNESLFSGWLLPTGKNGRFSYVRSEFVRIYEEGGVFLLDEIDASDPNTLLFINTAIANGYFTLPQRFNNSKIKKHKDFICIAAANTFGTGADSLYHGRNCLDAATLDRFRMGMVQMDYSQEVEEKLINPELLEWARVVRNIITSKNLLKILSTRFLIDATRMLKRGWSLDDIKYSFYLDWSPEEKRIVGEYNGV